MQSELNLEKSFQKLKTSRSIVQQNSFRKIFLMNKKKIIITMLYENGQLTTLKKVMQELEDQKKKFNKF